MFLAFFIIVRILFIMSMIFILRYVFSSSPKSPRFTVAAKVAAVLLIVVFVSMNIFLVKMHVGIRMVKGNDTHCTIE